YLSVRYVPAPGTLFADVRKLRPAHALVYEHGETREQCYWDVTFRPAPPRALADDLELIRGHVRRAVSERLIGEVPMGAMLSGGVDWGVCAGPMSTAGETRTKPSAVGSDQPGYNELPSARLAATPSGTDHPELTARSADLATYWPLLPWHRDEPVSEPS